MPESWRPANGTDYEIFQSRFCDRCLANRGLRDGSDPVGCDIEMRALAYEERDPKYPVEWVCEIDDEGFEVPGCTAFQRDWSVDDA